MPELPEVETIKRGLEKKIIGLKITDIQILNPKSFQGARKLIVGRKITRVWRRAKILAIDLDSKTLLVHLKMSGQLILVSHGPRVKDQEKFISGPKQKKENTENRFIGGHPTQDMSGQMPNKSTRVIFTFSDNSKLYFNDQRKFGWIKVVSQGSGVIDQVLGNLGPEPLDKEFTQKILKIHLQKHKSLPIKVALMDQQTIAGIGNIYASESLFNDGINPQKIVSKLTDNEISRLHRGIITALKNSIKYGGSSRTHFVNADGEKGVFLDFAYVYQRAKKPCKICQAPIAQIKQAGRSTFFCPNCQK